MFKNEDWNLKTMRSGITSLRVKVSLARVYCSRDAFSRSVGTLLSAQQSSVTAERSCLIVSIAMPQLMAPFHHHETQASGLNAGFW